MLYHIIRFYIKIALLLFYKKRTIVGKENIPKKGAVLFVSNHQNALMDPLVITVSTRKPMYYLARASAFKNKIASKLLRKLHMVAIYRVRDGVNSKALNEAVFDQCTEILNKNNSILIFPEGSHNKKRKVRSLRAGFARISFDYLKANKDKDLTIIPIGLNYDNTVNYAKSLYLIYGKPISVTKYFDKNDIKKSTGNLINEVHNQLSKLSVYIDDDKNYEKIVSQFDESDFLTPNKTNEKIKNLKIEELKIQPKQQSKSKNIFYYLMMLNSIFPFLIWKWLQPRIEAIEFISTTKFSLGLTVFPIFYALQTVVINHFFDGMYALYYIALTFILIILSAKTRK